MITRLALGNVPRGKLSFKDVISNIQISIGPMLLYKEQMTMCLFSVRIFGTALMLNCHSCL